MTTVARNMNSHQNSTNGEIQQYFGEIENNEARLCVSFSKMVDDVSGMITVTTRMLFETE